MQRQTLPLLLAAALLSSTCVAYNILFMCPFPAPSHWMWMEHFSSELLRRGHNVTTLTNHPVKQPHPNLTQIIIEPHFNITYYYRKEDIFKMHFSSEFANLNVYWHVGLLSSEHALAQPAVKALIASKHLTFDLIVLEQFFHESFLMFAHKFKCPVVTLGTMGYADNMDHAMGLLTPWSFVPHLFLSHTDRMDFFERACNTYLSLYDAVLRRWYYMPRMQEMAEKYFEGFIEGPLPQLSELVQNISLMLINSHRAMDAPRPSMPGLVNVGGIHIKPAKPLPKDLQSYLDNSTHGVIYFSLGSYLQSTDIPFEKIQLLLNAFARLEQNVLWKFENHDTNTKLPKNVKIYKWLPQNDILAHPNLKLFITHGGIFSTQEGIHWGKPLLCIPFFGDQHRNAMKVTRAGYARTLSFDTITSEDLVHNIRMLINDDIYKRKAMEASRLFRDNPTIALQEASFWLEYVIRHNGAIHLKSHGAYMPLYQYLLLDVLAGVVLFLFLVVSLIAFLGKVISRLMLSPRRKARSSEGVSKKTIKKID
ncbi:PREDICTED: UDP-glucuronosyltransferase 2B4-like isoform X2 [Rhagoletis zephyria]|nr:PREDICTED: UDP-glucuronosyltransferase 2B4-like isoform X2 [Rhagoletis zephyria]XP_017482512.1 PREDICTED: UDP-glucuronosyltransferase 2B4-like isoform X2 [Rhagoletis zephyria]XP_017482513.1 PREDICTED: UDP-glucuronosyltransferase 2B4-like isoform X2 [Rhagoletis zephyria]XP_017482514.1 PREDICTED: UDP-glucuronosyltransferase 2B4-like isoform X2 [Rhagoletis zephyria]